MTLKTIQITSTSRSNSYLTSLSPLEFDLARHGPLTADGRMNTTTLVAEGISDADFAFVGSIDEEEMTIPFAEATNIIDFAMTGTGAVVEVRDEEKGGPSTPVRETEGIEVTDFAKTEWSPRSEKRQSSKSSTSAVNSDMERSSMSTSSVSDDEQRRQSERRISVSRIV
jgi:hypothetical protein